MAWPRTLCRARRRAWPVSNRAWERNTYIAGQDRANPVATILSAAMMLDWLGERHGLPALGEGDMLIEEAVEEAFAARALRPMEFGGDQGLRAATNAITEVLQRKLKARER